MTDLIELATIVEKLEGPCRDTDAAIMGLFTHSVESDDGDWWYGPHDAMPIRVPDFTASLDAAMTLAPEGFQISLGNYPIAWWAHVGPSNDAGSRETAYTGATPALALATACLRARASLSKE